MATKVEIEIVHSNGNDPEGDGYEVVITTARFTEQGHRISREWFGYGEMENYATAAQAANAASIYYQGVLDGLSNAHVETGYNRQELRAMQADAKGKCE